MLTLLKLLKPMKTDRKSIVDSGSLDITSGSRLKWPFMPKQGPRSSTVQYSTVQYCILYSTGTVLYSTVQYGPHPIPVSLEIQAPSHHSKN